MTPEQVGLLAESWNAAAGRREEIARTFYQVLFEGHPELRRLFARTDMTTQYEKFAKMVDEIVGLGREPRRFVRSAAQLGQRHAAYGVTRDHYGPAGVALIDVLARALGPAFTPAVREAWADGYLLMASIMCRAAERGPETRAAS